MFSRRHALHVVSGWACLVPVVLLCGGTSHAAEFPVGSAADITAALSSAGPGDTLVMADGVWANQQIDFAGIGNAANPITLRTQTPGGVTLNGNSTLSISGDWLVVKDLKFEGGALNSGHVVRFTGSLGDATNSRFTNSAIINYNPADINTRYHWVSLYGDNNRVDHNIFSGMNHSGVTVVDWADGTESNHRIDSNHFADRPVGNANGFETIRIGTGAFRTTQSHDIIENNLFERTDGEIEIISNKTESNIYRYNTFRESAGTLTIRQGAGVTVEGNFFLGQNKPGSGGVRVIGEDHTVINNYFADLDDRAEGAISISAGVPGVDPLYPQVKNALIAHNTIVGIDGAAITFDNGLGSSGRTLLAEDVTIANNLIRSAETIFEGNEGTGWVWEGNIAYGGGLGPKTGAPGITVQDPQLVLDAEGLWRPGPGSPAINGSVGDYSASLTHDMDGQARIGIFDVGADEVSAATIVRAPLTPGDVGPDWLNRDPGAGSGGGGCFLDGCAVQAEAYKAVTDPNDNNLVWAVINTPIALGGSALQAPLGDRTDVGLEPHDTLAVYEVTLLSEGTYTAYYRARGFSTSTDSIYTPAGFNTDPTVNENLAEDGAFHWEKGQSFLVTASHVGMPLEFRVGRREQSSEFDAWVLHLDAGLTDSELDALFDRLVGDLDGDGFVGINDLNLILANWNQSVPPGNPLADPSGDGFVGIDDLNRVLGNWNAGTPPGSEANIPEPGVLSIWVASLLLMAHRR